MTSLLSFCFWIMLLLNRLETCTPYNGQLSEYKHGKTRYYELQTEWYINNQTTKVTADEAWPYFNIPDCPWNTFGTFKKAYYRIRNAMKQPNSTPVTLTHNVTYNSTTPDTDQYVKIVDEMKRILKRLQSRRDHISMITKQTLLSAACCLDEDGHIENRPMMEYLMPKIDCRCITKSVSMKNTFNTSDTSLLHDPNASNKGGAKRLFSEQVDKSIVTFWLENTTEDPNTAKHRVIKDSNGKKVKKPYRYCHMKYGEMHHRWVLSYKAQYGHHVRVPKLTYFMDLKPSWVYKAKTGDYSQCKKCYNFTSMTKALLRRLSAKDAHLIGSVLCPKSHWYDMESDECSCSECLRCRDTIAALKKSPKRLLQYLCCVNSCNYPDLECINGTCTDTQCGVLKVKQLLTSSLIRIPANDDIRFKQIIKIKRIVRGKEQTCHSTVYQTMLWKEFVVFYLEKLDEFMKHYNSWIFQHQNRRDFVDFKFGRIKNDSIYCHFDFINNIKALWDEMSNGMWGDRESVSFMVSYDRFRDADSKIVEESASYFCDDPKHDWSAATVFVRKHLELRQKEFREKYGRNLEHAFCWSDNGEFKCSGFLCKVSEIAEQLNITKHWNFTAGGHSKGKHDGEGHVVKSEYRSAVLAGLIQMDIQREPYSLTLQKYMTSHFSKKGVSKYRRSFYHVPAEEIKHFTSKSVCETLNGINSYHCFLMHHRKMILCRTLSCHCDWCIGVGWQRCKASSVCGSWEKKYWAFAPVESSVVGASSVEAVETSAVSSVIGQGAAYGYGAAVHTNYQSQNMRIPAPNGHNMGYVQQQRNPPALLYGSVHCNNYRSGNSNPY